MSGVDHITEIMPPNMPQWMWDAIDEGLLARRCMERVAKLEARTNTPLETSSEWKDAIACIAGLEDELEQLEARIEAAEKLPKKWRWRCGNKKTSTNHLRMDDADELESALEQGDAR